MLQLLGVYLLIDGIASLIMFKDQALFPNQTVRLGRTLIGAYLVARKEK